MGRPFLPHPSLRTQKSNPFPTKISTSMLLVEIFDCRVGSRGCGNNIQSNFHKCSREIIYVCLELYFEANFHKTTQNCGNSIYLAVPGKLFWKFPQIICLCGRNFYGGISTFLIYVLPLFGDVISLQHLNQMNLLGS